MTTEADVRPLHDAQEQFRREYLAAAFMACGQNVTRLAKALRRDRSGVQRLLKNYGIFTPRRMCEG